MRWSSVRVRSRIGAAIALWIGLALGGEAWATVSEPVLPVPLCTTMDGEKNRLGKRLYHDVRLSSGNSLSCASCHPLEGWGVDGLPTSVRDHGPGNRLNTPTVFNALFNIAQYWNGRVANLEELVEEEVRVQLGSDWNDVVRKISQDEGYRQDFARLYRGGIRGENLRDALAEFLRSLITPNSRFDRHLRGESGAITAEEQAGYALFKGLGCISCHQGVNLGGNMFHQSGFFAALDRDDPSIESGEADRFTVTGIAEDRRVFKVPGLRNVARTAPYFHEGYVTTLEEAVTVMARTQLGRELSERERSLLVVFLRTLDGTLYGECP
jgi:cytochrome c peroxidase